MPVVPEPSVCLTNAFSQRDPGAPAHVGQPPDIKQFAHRPVRLGRVGGDRAVEPDLGSDHLRKFKYRHIGACADIDVAEHRTGIGIIDRLRKIHHEQAGIGHVVDMQEFAPRGACAPEGNRRAAALRGLVEPPDQGGQNVGIIGMEIVARAIKGWSA